MYVCIPKVCMRIPSLQSNMQMQPRKSYISPTRRFKGPVVHTCMRGWLSHAVLEVQLLYGQVPYHLLRILHASITSRLRYSYPRRRGMRYRPRLTALHLPSIHLDCRRVPYYCTYPLYDCSTEYMPPASYPSNSLSALGITGIGDSTRKEKHLLSELDTELDAPDASRESKNVT